MKQKLEQKIELFSIANTLIEYQTIKYELTKEEMIALYFKQILRELEKEFILKEFEVISDDEQKKIVVEDSIDILYNTETINHKLNEIITKQNEYLKLKEESKEQNNLDVLN